MESQFQLKVEEVTLSFGGVTALSGVSFEVGRGEIFSIIGPNGAGKTSMLNCISGRYHPQRGTVLFEAHDVTDRAPAARARLGIARTFQNIALFKGMTVLDNLLIGRHIHLKSGVLRGGLYLGPCQKEEIEHRRFVEDIVDFLEIEHIRKRTVGTLAYGLQKRVELARALALDPKLILLDEPMAGMNLEETEDMVRFILDINQERGITVILVEHDMGVVMDISDRLVVLNFGEKIGEGTPEEAQKNPEVIRAYLGGEESVFLGR
ncbi:MAG: ABC transporter ATP-binding protein [Deltaproteobacteria bacterium]|nr:ABC transporter ATP-binding protein [Deltaproteobacteria bacterium]